MLELKIISQNYLTWMFRKQTRKNQGTNFINDLFRG